MTAAEPTPDERRRAAEFTHPQRTWRRCWMCRLFIMPTPTTRTICTRCERILAECAHERGEQP
jgi:hypothetical protein